MGQQTDWSRLQRPRYEVPQDITELLDARGLTTAFRNRPAYQQNDYIGWVMRAKREATRQKRISQMLDELAKGDVYMKMSWQPRKVSIIE